MGGQEEVREPCLLLDEVSHPVVYVGVQAVSEQHDRRLCQVLGAVDQRDEVPLAHAAAVALAGGVGEQAVTQSGPRYWPHRDQPGDR